MRKILSSWRAWFAIMTSAVLILTCLRTQRLSSQQPKRLNPAAWGSDHVGQPVPEYLTGDQCLFCHRKKVGPTWGANRHNLTIRPFEQQSPARTALQQSPSKDLAKEITFVLGHERRQYFLKPAKAYGKLDILSTQWLPAHNSKPGKLLATSRPHWDSKHFGQNCAGCHTTAVDSKEQIFSAVSLDCFVCHGNVHPDHTKKPELAYFSKKRKDPARVVISICAQCHIRTGKSKSSGLPYPNNFMAGDNLFRDFQVDFSDEKMKKLSTMDRHILHNVRDVIVFGKKDVTCLSCHNVHTSSGRKHRRLPKTDICLHCHHAKGPSRNLKTLTAHGKTCEFLK